MVDRERSLLEESPRGSLAVLFPFLLLLFGAAFLSVGLGFSLLHALDAAVPVPPCTPPAQPSGPAPISGGC